MTSVTAGYLGGLIAVALVTYLAATASPRAKYQDGQKVLYYDTRMKVVGWALLAIASPMVVFFLYAAAYQPAKDAAFFIVGSVLFLSLPLTLILEFQNVTVAFDANAIYCSSPWRRPRTVPWGDVRSIRYSDSLRWYVVKTGSHGTIRLSNVLSGLHEFLAEAQRRQISANRALLPYVSGLQPRRAHRTAKRGRVENANLRRRLIREHLTDLLAMCVAVSAMVYLVSLLFISVFETGTITLNAGGRFGRPVPVTLELRTLPFAVVGSLLIFAAFVGVLAQLAFRPAYQLVRLCFPAWQLPRVPRWAALQRLSSVQFATPVVIAGLGALLVAVQYLAVVLT